MENLSSQMDKQDEKVELYQNCVDTLINLVRCPSQHNHAMLRLEDDLTTSNIAFLIEQGKNPIELLSDEINTTRSDFATCRSARIKITNEIYPLLKKLLDKMPTGKTKDNLISLIEKIEVRRQAAVADPNGLPALFGIPKSLQAEWFKKLQAEGYYDRLLKRSPLDPKAEEERKRIHDEALKQLRNKEK